MFLHFGIFRVIYCLHLVLFRISFFSFYSSPPSFLYFVSSSLFCILSSTLFVLFSFPSHIFSSLIFSCSCLLFSYLFLLPVFSFLYINDPTSDIYYRCLYIQSEKIYKLKTGTLSFSLRDLNLS